MKITAPPSTSPRRAGRLLAVVAGLAAASVALSGCLYTIIPESRPSSTASLAPDTDGVDADLLPFYEQTLSWSDCDGFECTTVTAPLDWADPGAGEIELSVIRQRALSGEPIGSLLTNPGGPGASGVGLIRDSIGFAVGAPLQEQFDVIGFDPRGVGESTAVRCLDAAGMDAYLFDIPADPRGSDGWTAERTEWNQEFSDACEANSDGILPFITTENAARDMDLLRAVLGDAELNYLGYSYGTFLGATYAQLYPERVGRLVLDGAIDPSVSGVDVSTTQAIGFESALRAYMTDCLADSECPFRGTVDEGMADLGTLLASVDRTPLPAADGRLLGADSLLTGIIAALYSQDSWPYLTIALSDALQGDPEVGVPVGGLLLQPRERGVPRQLDRGVPRLQLHGLSGRHHRRGAGRGRCADRRRGADRGALLVGPRPVRELAVPADRNAGRDRRRRCRSDRGRRHDQRPRDAVRVVGGARRAALVGRAHHPGG